MILLDLTMPKIDGFQLVTALRALPELATSAIVVCSRQPDLLERVKLLGVAAALEKPVGRDTLLAVVRQHC